jgi:hypothetical protein
MDVRENNKYEQPSAALLDVEMRNSTGSRETVVSVVEEVRKTKITRRNSLLKTPNKSHQRTILLNTTTTTQDQSHLTSMSNHTTPHATLACLTSSHSFSKPIFMLNLCLLPLPPAHLLRYQLSHSVHVYTPFAPISSTYDHRTLKTRLPVRSALFKQRTGGLVVRWVTTGESPLLYVFWIFFWHTGERLARGVKACFWRMKWSLEGMEQGCEDAPNLSLMRVYIWKGFVGPLDHFMPTAFKNSDFWAAPFSGAMPSSEMALTTSAMVSTS